MQKRGFGMKRNAEDGENAEEDAKPGRWGLRGFPAFLIKMLHRSGFAIPRRPLRLCGYHDFLDGSEARRNEEQAEMPGSRGVGS